MDTEEIRSQTMVRAMQWRWFAKVTAIGLGIVGALLGFLLFRECGAVVAGEGFTETACAPTTASFRAALAFFIAGLSSGVPLLGVAHILEAVASRADAD